MGWVLLVTGTAAGLVCLLLRLVRWLEDLSKGTACTVRPLLPALWRVSSPLQQDDEFLKGQLKLQEKTLQEGWQKLYGLF